MFEFLLIICLTIRLLVYKSGILLLDILFHLQRDVSISSQFCSVNILKLVDGYEIMETETLMPCRDSGVAVPYF